MVGIPGSSKFLGAATLANRQGLAAQTPNLLGESNIPSILESGRNINSGNGIGISDSARAFNQQFLNRTADINAMFSLGVGASATIEGLQQQILALRAKLPDSSISPSALGNEVDEEA